MFKVAFLVSAYGMLAAAMGGAGIWSRSTSPGKMIVFSDSDASVHSETASVVPTDTRIRRDTDGHFYMTANANGVPVKFLFDTGATTTVLTAADAKRIGSMDNHLRRGSMITVSNRTPVRWTTIDHIQIADRSIADSEAVIVSSDLPVSLLGQNVIDRMGRITLSGDWLELH